MTKQEAESLLNTTNDTINVIILSLSGVTDESVDPCEVKLHTIKEVLTNLLKDNEEEDEYASSEYYDSGCVGEY